MPEEHELVAVSSRHSVRLAEEYMGLIRHAPSRDFVVRTIAKRDANGLPLVRAEIVIAGREAREQFPAAHEYPLHFRKTYYPARLHGDPKDEFDRQSEASAIIGVPKPIGYGPDVFRACLLPGTSYDRLSPFGIDPEEAAVRQARDLPLAAAAGLWVLAEQAFASLVALHAGGLAHGDAELHNFIVCPSPLEIFMIDFEVALRRDAVTDEVWQKTSLGDFDRLLREANLLQCCLGPQIGRFAQMAAERSGCLFADPDRVRDEIERRATPA